MTERLYYASDMLECTALVLRCDQQADGRYAIVLDKTVFHPQGGGQPADKGWIAGIPVESVLQHGDDVVHILAQPLSANEVRLQVDAVCRALHARLHSAGHVIGYAGEQYGWRPVKAHHWPGKGASPSLPGRMPANRRSRCWMHSLRVGSLRHCPVILPLRMGVARCALAISRPMVAAVRMSLRWLNWVRW